ncbi:MAG: regulatory protein RecX [Cardiobacteriaceae bacterium]|nr:regulatory protein RecX [Cardiobacteriaceae bacterium]
MHEDERRAFEQRCLNALARREHSRAELAARGAETPAEVVAAVLDELAAKGWQSDERFAESYVRAKAGKGDGRLKIAHGLRGKGIAEALAREALAAIDWREAARTAYTKKYATPATTPAERAKRQRFLAQRGFTFDDINAVLKNHE